MNQIRITFKGDGTLSEDDKVRWDTGYREGLEHTLKTYKLGRGKKLPYDFRSAKCMGPYWRGWNEGAIAGRSTVLDRDYPNMVLLSLRSESGVLGDGSLMWYDLKFKNGRAKQVLVLNGSVLKKAGHLFRWYFFLRWQKVL